MKKVRFLSGAGVPATLFLSVISASPGCHRGEATDAPAVADAGAIATLPATERSDAAGDGNIPPPPDLKAPPAGAVKTPSGLVTIVLKRGAGKVHPLENDLVHLEFVAWTTDGRTYGASDPPPNPPWLGRMYDQIEGASEALAQMVVGEKRRLWIPAALARYPGHVPEDLVMDVELVEIVPTPKPPPIPEDAASPPASAKTTSSGLRWRLVASGPKGGARPDLNSIAVYNFTTWTRKGEMLKSTFPDGAPKSDRVAEMPPPWSEAMQLMKVGDTLRLWFTPSQGGPPGNTYVADVALLYVYALPHEAHKGDAHR